MKLHGEFILRQVLDDVLAIPVGQTALNMNGMILLNDVSTVIWNCLKEETSVEAIVNAVTDAFEVSAEEAELDIQEFLNKMRNAGLLEE